VFALFRCGGSRNAQLAVESQTELILHRQEWKRNGKRVVCVAGAFDLLHPGHVRLLEQARGLGDILVVALQSDESVRIAAEQAYKLIGAPAVPSPAAAARNIAARPITPQGERAEILAALAAVDFVTIFEEATAAEFIARLAPDVFAQGGEGSRENASVDDDAVKAAGGQVVRLPLDPGYSTSRLLERISQP
jgi:D-beta-D-heptose 7-phosphate kinase/D-beta-D-heptose 1-phosphate adenosyltransferase